MEEKGKGIKENDGEGAFNCDILLRTFVNVTMLLPVQQKYNKK
jgi:hypothetical protein